MQQGVLLSDSWGTAGRRGRRAEVEAEATIAEGGVRGKGTNSGTPVAQWEMRGGGAGRMEIDVGAAEAGDGAGSGAGSARSGAGALPAKTGEERWAACEE